MARAARRGFTPRRAKRAAPAWGFLISPAELVVASDTKVLLATFVLSNPPLGETILRTRARLWVRSDQSAGLEPQTGAFGLIVVSDRAADAGAVAIPGPGVDGADDGWFVHQTIVQSQETAAVSGGTGYDIDSKAMRKVEDGMVIAVMVENFSPAVATGFVFGFSVRLLAKLTES